MKNPRKSEGETSPAKKRGKGAKKRRGLGRGLDAFLSEPDVGVTEARDAAPVKKTERARTTLTVVEKIPVERISPNPNQPRKRFSDDSLAGLAKSIETRGILQPLLVRRAGESYELVAGERRLRAAKKLGLKTVPCIVTELTDEESFQSSLVENLQREDLNPIELARGLALMRDALKLTQENIAAELGVSRPYVANTLRLLYLPDDIQDLVRNGELSSGAARALLALDAVIASDLAVRVVAEGFSVRQIEELVRGLEAAGAASEIVVEAKDKEKAPVRRESKYLVDLAVRLTKHMGTRVTIKELKKGGTINVRYHSNDDLDRLLEFFGVTDDPI